MRTLLVPAGTAPQCSCMVGPDYRRPPALPDRAVKPREAGVAGITPSPLPTHWWRLFDDPDLDRLVGRDGFLLLLVAERDRAVARAALARARADRPDAQLSLFKALGGGWEDAPDIEVGAATK